MQQPIDWPTICGIALIAVLTGSIIFAFLLGFWCEYRGSTSLR